MVPTTISSSDSSNTLPANSSISAGLRCFCSCFERFGTHDDPSKELRNRAWKSIDKNGNRNVSLAEAVLWIKETLMQYTQDKDKTDIIHRSYYPSYIRAFNDAADIGGETVAGGKRLLQCSEFRLFTAYLGIYALMWDSFRLMNGLLDAAPTTGDDRKLVLSDWELRHADLLDSPFVALRANAVEVGDSITEAFGRIDADGNGCVLFADFCQYVKKSEIAADTPIGRLLHIGDA
jgi:hypothetical protein